MCNHVTAWVFLASFLWFFVSFLHWIGNQILNNDTKLNMADGGWSYSFLHFDGAIFGSFSSHFPVIFGHFKLSFSSHFWVIFFSHFGAIFESFLGHFWVIFGHFERFFSDLFGWIFPKHYFGKLICAGKNQIRFDSIFHMWGNLMCVKNQRWNGGALEGV